MDFLREKQNVAFCRFLLALCALWLLCAGLLSALILREARQSLREREAVIVSGLLAQGVEERTAAAALGGGTASAQGWAFLEKTGRGGSAGPAAFPETERLARLVPGLLCGSVLLFGLLLLAGSGAALARRETAYRRATEVIEGFLKGDFGKHLPTGEPGGYYRLLFAAEELARALQSRNEEERRSKLFLRDMISDISHQLKTPLAALSLYLDIMESESAPDGDAAAQRAPDAVLSFAGRARQSVDRMESLVRTLLKMARLDVGGVVFERSRIRAGDLAERAVQQLRVRAGREGKRLCLEGDPRAEVYCDPAWTAEALENLVKNALDHTKEGGGVRIDWKASPGCLRLSVSDDGCGIAPEDLHHIFKRFYRGGTSGGPVGERAGGEEDGQSGEGLGLGLPLAKAIVEGQGGVLGVESAPGRGAVFSVVFSEVFLTKP